MKIYVCMAVIRISLCNRLHFVPNVKKRTSIIVVLICLNLTIRCIVTVNPIPLSGFTSYCSNSASCMIGYIVIDMVGILEISSHIYMHQGPCLVITVLCIWPPAQILHLWIIFFGKIAHWTDEFSTDALGEMLSIICKCRSSK